MTMRVAPAAPAVAIVGEIEVIVGFGGDEAEIVNGVIFESAPELDTSIFTVPVEAMYGAGTVAMSCVEPTNCVAKTEGGACGDTIHSTIEPFTKFAPFTVRVNAEGLHDGVEFDEVVEADKDVIFGGTIMNGRDVADAPPPGPRLNAETFAVWTVAAPTRSADGIRAPRVAAPPPLPAT